MEDSGDALEVDLDDPFQAQMLDISQPITADEQMLRILKQQVCVCVSVCVDSGISSKVWACRLGMTTHLVQKAVDSVQGLQGCKTVFCAFMAALQGACILAEGSLVYQPSCTPVL